MFRAFPVMLTLLLLTASNSCAGLYSFSYDRSGAVVATVEIENKGIFNLVTSIDFLRKPQDNKIFGSDEYQDMINRVSVEARGVMLQTILEAKQIKLSELAALKGKIEKEIENLIDKNKGIYGVTSTPVVFSIGTFYLLELKVHE
ncbi:MAG: hypothetical protein KKD73_07780 [Proteobacteria bacterium]|nr:hypothetical protein [Pseudomonadota bacterium]